MQMVSQLAGACGRLLSANDSAMQVQSCVIAIAGGVWADQLIHWRRYQHHWLTIPLLALVTAVLAILGLLPLMNNFAHIAGFVAGFLACFVALLNRRVRIFI